VQEPPAGDQTNPFPKLLAIVMSGAFVLTEIILRLSTAGADRL